MYDAICIVKYSLTVVAIVCGIMYTIAAISIRTIVHYFVTSCVHLGAWRQSKTSNLTPGLTAPRSASGEECHVFSCDMNSSMLLSGLGLHFRDRNICFFKIELCFRVLRVSCFAFLESGPLKNMYTFLWITSDNAIMHFIIRFSTCAVLHEVIFHEVSCF